MVIKKSFIFVILLLGILPFASAGGGGGCSCSFSSSAKCATGTTVLIHFTYDCCGSGVYIAQGEGSTFNIACPGSDCGWYYRDIGSDGSYYFNMYNIAGESVGSTSGSASVGGVCAEGTTQGCGYCGSQTCSASCAWGSCTGEGSCAAGTTQGCGYCGSQTCSASCAWGSCTGEGSCSPGSTQACGNCGIRTCTSSCTWGACTGEGSCASGATQSCGNCGTQTCSASCAWGSCTGEGSCAVGATSSQGCGNCGTQSRTCSASCAWGSYGTCTGEGVCAVGATSSQGCGNCGTQSRTCNSSCGWGSYGTCTGEGVCAVDDTRSCYTGPAGTSGVGVCRTGLNTCSASCAWGTTCAGQVTPSAENTAALCSDGLDNDCDGLTDSQEIVTCDFTNPEITSINHFPSEPVIQENVNISTTVVEDNVFNVSVYADNSEIAKCLSQRECSGRVSYGNIGYHNYLSYTSDWAGHYAVSPTRNFSVGGDATKSCLENTGNFGSVCDENYYCGSGGAFVNSQDGGVGDNQFSQQPGEASCCTTGDCTSSYVMPKCEGPPVFGVEYDPEIAACNGFEVIAEVEDPESIKCCAGTLTGKAGNTEEFDSYWSRQNSGYFKLAEAAEGDHLYCVAINQSGLNTVNFTIQKGDTKTNQIITAVGGVAKMPVTAEETGTYTCTAEMNGAIRTTELKVTEAGKDPTKLPVFNILQLIIALAIIGIYYGKKN